MPKLSNRAFTQAQLNSLKTPAGVERMDRFDAHTRGLGIRVSANGNKTWFVMRRVNGTMTRASLGRYPELGIGDARKRAAAMLAKMADGEQPKPPKTDLFATVAEEWLRRDQSKNRSFRDVELAMKGHVLPRLGKRPIASIARADITRMLDRIVDAGSPIMANRVRAYLRRMFNWCMERGIVAANPTDGTRPPAREVSRDRVLSQLELLAIWQGAARLTHPWGALTRMLVLTGQRLEEVAKATWSEIDLDSGTWSLSGNRTKNGRAHTVNLSAAMLELLGALPRRAGCPWIFSTDGEHPVSGFSKFKKRLDKESGVSGWTFHDLRRTFATMASETLAISPVVVDRILNHVSGVVRGVAAIYQRGEYLEQRRIALETWGQFVTTLLQKDGNVIHLRPTIQRTPGHDEKPEAEAVARSDAV